MKTRGRVAIFGPHPLLSITLELHDDTGDDVHLHAAGQGVWVARMAAELGAEPVLRAFSGGETGAVLEQLLARIGGERRFVPTLTPSGSYVMDRRDGERRLLAERFSDPPSRHELDDLVSITCAAALDCDVLVVCNSYPAGALSLESMASGSAMAAPRWWWSREPAIRRWSCGETTRSSSPRRASSKASVKGAATP